MFKSSPDQNLSSVTSCSHSRKRRRSERTFSLRTFADPGCPCDFDGPFRDNIRTFLRFTTERELCDVEGRHAWSVCLQQEDLHSAYLTLYIIEEDIQTSPHPHCDHCRCIGWSHHLVSNRRYHFIIPAPEIGDRPLGVTSRAGSGKVCPNCHDPVAPSAYSCSTCNEDAVQGSILDLHTHLLHGMLHCNGFGHLLCVNGREKGSRYASGREIVDLWDRICSMLRARKVSVEDLAKKRSLELRLLHCVAYGESWFGRWGYKFGHGSFGITQQMYAKAIEALRGMPLNVMLQHFEGVDQEVIATTSMYQRISGQSLQTVGDLVRFMLELKARLPLHATASKCFPKITNLSKSDHHHHDRKGNGINGGAANATTPSTSTTSSTNEMPCRWSVKRLELATQVIVEALKNCEKKWMPRQDVRDAARVYIGDTGLLDFVLKSLGNKVVGNHVVRRAVNPMTKVLEYSLEDLNVSCGGGVSAGSQFGSIVSCAPLSSSDSGPCRGSSGLDMIMSSSGLCDVGRADVLRDIVYLYKHVLESYKPARKAMKSVLAAIPTASRIILDTKQLIKDYRGEVTRKCANMTEWGMDDDEMLRVMCTVCIKEDTQLQEEAAGQLFDDVLDVLLMQQQQQQSTAAGSISTGLSSDMQNNMMMMMMPAGAGQLQMSMSSCSMSSSGSTRSSSSGSGSSSSSSSSSTRPRPPPELVVLPPHATVGELKREAERAFRDTYYIMRAFKLESIPSLEGVDDDDLLFGNIESGSNVEVHGVLLLVQTTSSYGNGNVGGHANANGDHGEEYSTVSVNPALRYEGGSDSWVVDCPCGTKDDDGERMIACDVCEVWQHTRCGNIADSDAIPQRFLCSRCSLGLFKAML